MRLVSKTLSILSVLCVLLILSAFPVFAGCSGVKLDGELICYGDCGEGAYCTRNYRKDDCICLSYPTSTPEPTSAPQPTSVGGASPTEKPSYCGCNGSNCVGSTCVFKQKDCFKYNGFSCYTNPNFAVMEAYCNGIKCGNSYVCGYSANCSGAQNCDPNNLNCEAINLPLDCNYDVFGCNQCGVGRVAAIYCDFNGDGIKENHCGDLCTSNSLCDNNQWCSGGGDGGGGISIPTNTPVPTSTPTPTPNPYWVKLKDTSFYTSRSLTQTIPAVPRRSTGGKIS
jgi:hypothetical protein